MALITLSDHCPVAGHHAEHAEHIQHGLVDAVAGQRAEPGEEGLVFELEGPGEGALEVDAVPRSRALIWEHIQDAPGKPCPNPRVIIPRKAFPGVPLITAIIESVLDKKPMSPVLLGFIMIGIAGIAVLSVPNFRSGVQTDIFGTLMILLGSLFWSIGTIIQGRNRLPLAPTVNAGYQMLFGGVAFIIAALLLREPLPTPRLDAWLAWGYLVVFGSIIAFTSYVKVLHLLPTKIVMTYSYINPIVALVLGYLILSEPITVWTIAGTFLVLLGVFGVFSFHRREAKIQPVKP